MQIIIFLFAALWSAEPAAAEPPEPPCFRVVASQHATIESLTREELSKIFFKRIKSWDDGSEIIPIDRSSEGLREDFSDAVHLKGASFIETYWQRMIFSGRGEPPEKIDKERNVFSFLKKSPRAISYVSCGSELPSQIRAIKVVDENNVKISSTAVWGQDPEYLRVEHITIDDLQSPQAKLRILRFGNCGTDGRSVYLHNPSDRSLSAQIEQTLSREGERQYRSHVEHVAAPQSKTLLGCSRPTEGSEWSFQISEGA